MSDPVSAPKFDISQHIRYFGTGDVSVGQFYDKAVQLFVPKADRGTHDKVDLVGHAKAAALVAATMPFRGPQSGGSLTTIHQPTIAKSILPGSAGVADKTTGEVTRTRIDAFAASVDTNHDGKVTMAELQARGEQRRQERVSALRKRPGLEHHLRHHQAI